MQRRLGRLRHPIQAELGALRGHPRHVQARVEVCIEVGDHLVRRDGVPGPSIGCSLPRRRAGHDPLDAFARQRRQALQIDQRLAARPGQIIDVPDRWVESDQDVAGAGARGYILDAVDVDDDPYSWLFEVLRSLGDRPQTA